MSNNSIKIDNYSSLDSDITFLNQKTNSYNRIIPNSHLYNNRNECINESNEKKTLYSQNRLNNEPTSAKLTKDYYKNYFSSNFGENLNEFIEEEIVDTKQEIYTNIVKSVINVDSNNRNKNLYPNNNDYVIDLNKSYTNVKKVSMLSSEIPNTAFTIENTPENIANNNVVWQNFERNTSRIFDLDFNNTFPDNNTNKFSVVVCDAPNFFIKNYIYSPPEFTSSRIYDSLKDIVLGNTDITIEILQNENPIENKTLRDIAIEYGATNFVEILDKVGATTINDLIVVVEELIDELNNVPCPEPPIDPPNDEPNDPIDNGGIIFNTGCGTTIINGITVGVTALENLLTKLIGISNINEPVNSYQLRDLKPIKIYFGNTLDNVLPLPDIEDYYTGSEAVTTKQISPFIDDITLKQIFNSNYLQIFNNVLEIERKIEYYPNSNIFVYDIGNTIHNYLDGIYEMGQPFLMIYYFTNQISTSTYDIVVKDAHYMLGFDLKLITNFNYNIGLNKLESNVRDLYPIYSRRIKETFFGYIQIINFNPITNNILQNNTFINFDTKIDSGDYDDTLMTNELTRTMNDTLHLTNNFDNYQISIDSKKNKSTFSMKNVNNLSVNNIYYRPYIEKIDFSSNSVNYRKYFTIFLRIDDHNLMENDIIEINDINVTNRQSNTQYTNYQNLFDLIKNKPIRAHLCKFYNLSAYDITEVGSEAKNLCYRDYKNFIIDIYKWNFIPTETTISSNIIYIDLQEILNNNLNIKNYFKNIEPLNMGYALTATSNDFPYRLLQSSLQSSFSNEYVPFPSNYLYDYAGFTSLNYILEPITLENEVTNYSASFVRKSKNISTGKNPYSIIGFNQNSKGSDLIKKVKINHYQNFFSDNVGLPRRLYVINSISDNHQLMNNDFVLIKDKYNLYSVVFNQPKKMTYINDMVFQYIDYENVFSNLLFVSSQLNNTGYMFLENTYNKYSKNLNPLTFYDTDFIFSKLEIFDDYKVENGNLVILYPDLLTTLQNNRDKNGVIIFKLQLFKQKTYYRYLSDNILVEVSRENELEPDKIENTFKVINNLDLLVIPENESEFSKYELPKPLQENILYFGLLNGDILTLYNKYEDTQFYPNTRKITITTDGYGRFLYNLNDIIRVDYPNHTLYDIVNTISIVNVDIISTKIQYQIYRQNKDIYFIQLLRPISVFQKNLINSKVNNIEIISNYNGHYSYLSNYNKEDIPNRKINYQPNRYILVRSKILSNNKPDLINNYNLDENNPLRDDIDKVDDLFTKISLNSTNSVIFDSYLCNNKTYNESPINVLNKIDFSFYREDGKPFSFKGLEHSFCLEIVEYIDELKNVNYSSVRGMKDTIGFSKDILCNEN